MFVCRLIHSDERIPIRLYLSNESGYSLDITMYKEVMDDRVRKVPAVLESFACSSSVSLTVWSAWVGSTLKDCFK